LTCCFFEQLKKLYESVIWRYLPRAGIDFSGQVEVFPDVVEKW